MTSGKRMFFCGAWQGVASLGLARREQGKGSDDQQRRQCFFLARLGSSRQVLGMPWPGRAWRRQGVK